MPVTRTTALVAAALLSLPWTAAAGEAIEDALAGAHRTDAEKARDDWRHPAATLGFFGLEPDMTVVELWPGGGWYTAILAPVLKDSGRLIAATYGATDDPESYRSRSHHAFLETLAAHPEVYGAVRVITFWPPESTRLGPPGSADRVLTFRNIHSMLRRNQAEAFFTAAFEVLKPGGVLGVVQHRAPAGTAPGTLVEKGYVTEANVIGLAEAAGFRLDARSEINANPRDTRDYPEGVWTLPPTLRLGDVNLEQYLEIGESDRMTLRFVKP